MSLIKSARGSGIYRMIHVSIRSSTKEQASRVVQTQSRNPPETNRAN